MSYPCLHPAGRPSRPYELPSRDEIVFHRHIRPYATLVLEGAYAEAGEAGRWRAEPGDILVHGFFSAHRDVIRRPRTIVLDLLLPATAAVVSTRLRLKDPDSVVRIAQTDPVAAAELALLEAAPAGDREADAPDLLAADLAGPECLPIAEWSEAMGLARETVSRRFRQLYGIPPARFRHEARARSAWNLTVWSDRPLADIAAEAGFADQAHMTRAVKALTGDTPARWRMNFPARSHSFKT